MLAAACASSNNQSDSPVTVQIAAVDQPSNVFYFAGPIALRFQVVVNNPTDETLTLRRLDLQTAGSGAFILHSSSPMNVTIPPKQTTAMTISVWGRALGGYLHSNEPVILRSTVFFNGPRGSFVKINQGMMQPE